MRAALTLLLAAVLAASQQPLTLGRALSRVADPLGLLREFPADTRHRQFSSFDRRSLQGPADPEAWFANEDRGHYLEAQKGRYVLCDVEGPGLLVRVWSANPKGVWRLEVDGALVTALPARDFFGPALAPPPLAGVRSRGHNLYLPLPFARRLRLVSDTGDFYYHVNVLRFPPQTPVRGVTAAALRAARKEIARAARRLREAARPPTPTAWERLTLPPGGRWRTRLTGPGRLEFTALKDLRAADPAAVLRRTVLTVDTDGERTLVAPLAEFFGCGPWRGGFTGLLCGLRDGVYYQRLPMPFARRLLLEFHNRSGTTLTARWAYGVTPGEVTTPLRLYGRYGEARGLPTRPRRDLTLLRVRGRGHFVGLVFTVSNPVWSWWGEGDEKVYVDGETFPGIFGTGTEDYFGYAWSSTDTFSHPYHAQPVASPGPGNYGLATANRFHVLDPIPFGRNLRFDLELWHWADCRVDLAWVAFFYARPGARVEGPPGLAGPPHWKPPGPYRPFRVAGLLEAEGLPFYAESGRVTVRRLGLRFSGDAQLTWKKAALGRRLTVFFPAPAPGPYRLTARLTCAESYGRFAVEVNGAAGPVLDLYRAEATVREVDLGVFPLGRVNRLVFVRRPPDPRAKGGDGLGLDGLRLTAAAPPPGAGGSPAPGGRRREK